MISRSSYLASSSPSISPNPALLPQLHLPTSSAVEYDNRPLNLGKDEDEDCWAGEALAIGYGFAGSSTNSVDAWRKCPVELMDFQCHICSDTATDPCVTRCGHLFCHGELLQHLKTSPRCPVCETDTLMERDVVPVFARGKRMPLDLDTDGSTHVSFPTSSSASGTTFGTLSALPVTPEDLPSASVTDPDLRSRPSSVSKKQTNNKPKSKKKLSRAVEPTTMSAPTTTTATQQVAEQFSHICSFVALALLLAVLLK